MKPPCILFLLDWKPVFWSTREEYYARIAQRLHAVGIRAVLTVSGEIEPRVRQRFEQAGAEVNVFPYLARYWQYGAYIHGITRRYDVLLAHVRFFDYFSLVPWLCRLNGIRQIIFTEANSGESVQRARWKTALIHLRTFLTTLPVTKAVAISEFIRQRLLDCGIPAAKTCVIYNGIDTDAFVPAPERRSSPPDTAPRCQIVFLSALLAWKRPELVIDVCQQLVSRGVNVTILAGGVGPLHAALLQRTEELGLTPHLRWLGHHPHPQHLLQSSDIFLHTAVGEAFGNVLAEAMACGTPVVATNSGATGEVVEDSVTGILVPPQPRPAEASALAAAIEELARNPAHWQRMSEAGRERALRRFAIPVAVRENLSLYRDILANSSPAIAALGQDDAKP